MKIPPRFSIVNVTYDALGRAVELSYGSSHTEIVYGPDGVSKLALMNSTANLVTGFIALPSGATAVYKPGVLPAYYRHSDWLGSSRLSIQPNHTKYFDTAYAPFGENYAGGTGTGGAIDLNFTGANQDIISGLYDFLYREYHPVQGRWISPDPAGLAAVDMTYPQTWNRYAYVGNNPTSAVDPLGLFRSDNVGGGDDGCYVTFSCIVYVDQTGMQLDNAWAQQLLRLDAASRPFWINGREYAQGVGNSYIHLYPDGSSVEVDASEMGQIGVVSAPDVGTTGPPDPTNMNKPLFCNSQLRSQASQAFMVTGNGRARDGLAEAGFSINLGANGLSFGTMTDSVHSDGIPNQLDIATFINAGPLPSTIAILHTHGNGLLATPSPGDLRSRFPNFVVSLSAWYVTIPGSSRYTKLNSRVCR
jgi:RHS repeat-associated protein